MHVDRHLPGEVPGFPGMVEVRVGQQNRFELETFGLQRRDQPGDTGHPLFNLKKLKADNDTGVAANATKAA